MMNAKLKVLIKVINNNFRYDRNIINWTFEFDKNYIDLLVDFVEDKHSRERIDMIELDNIPYDELANYGTQLAKYIQIRFLRSEFK